MKKRKIEDDINNLISKFFKKWVGKGPKFIKTRVFEDFAVIRFKRYPMPLIDHLLTSKQGRIILRDMNKIMFNLCKDNLKKQLNKTLDVNVKTMYLDTEKLEGEMALTITFKDKII